MKLILSCAGMLLVLLAPGGCVHPPAPRSSSSTVKLTPADLSTIRGANYRGADATNTTDYWRHYNAAETERDLTYADRLKLNQLRVFVNDASWQADKPAFRRNLGDLARACNRHHLGLMITIGDTQTFIKDDGSIDRGRIRGLVSALVGAIGGEPALSFWDASNEPDYNAAGTPPDRQQKRFEIARLIAATLHELDKRTPVTIGAANERNMETLADAVDVLSFHDYLPTRAAISNDIVRAKAFAAKSGKQVMDTETGCIARANPYDVTIEEHMKARVGWYIWELMITKRWGDVHGVFYPDGSVRDPSIPAAMLGLFRNRADNVILENLNREGWVKTDITNAQSWQDNPAGAWSDGLNAAEKLANLLEGGQAIAMREPPTRTIALLRQGPPKPEVLREVILITSPCCGLTNGPELPRPRESARAPSPPSPRRLPSTQFRAARVRARRQILRPSAAPTIAMRNTAATRACGITIHRRSPSVISPTRSGSGSTRFVVSSPTRPMKPIASNSGGTSCTWCAPPTSAASASCRWWPTANRCRGRPSGRGRVGKIPGGHTGQGTWPGLLGRVRLKSRTTRPTNRNAPARAWPLPNISPGFFAGLTARRR